MNERQFQNNPDYPATDRVLRLVVGSHVSSTDGNGDMPNQLVTLNNPEDHPVIDKQFTFETKNGQWLINGVGFEDVENRVLAFPKQGKVQRWELINNSGGWSHPIHIHLIDFQVTKRSGGRAAVEPYEATASKDVVYLGQNEKVQVVANFAPWSGVYMFHCHNLVHEDDDMMAAFNVSQVDLSAFGYPKTTSFIDPMTPAFRSKPGSAAYLADIPVGVLKRFQDLNAYPDSRGVENALRGFYATATDAADVPVSTGGSGGGGGGKTTLSTKTSSSKTSTAT
ncbi:Bilirubin oxidase [Lachnellula arida]|uniref:Bilirubin oxidase n=1 Tax=Lachnellula arida TaxID=1316785 RepID=A0A8T9BC81_9HELO|nr:Bilirubin oxidase [Lachnellula arida]